MEQILEEMRRLRDDVKASQEEAALQVARSSRRDPYTFKRKGNENQHAFNDDVEDKLVQVQAHLGRVEAGEEGTRSASALAKAKEAVKEDILSVGVLPLLRDSQDPDLRRLAAELPAVVLDSRADSTTKKYLGAFQRWKTWAAAHQEVPSFPVQEGHLALYMVHLSESTQSKAAVEEIVHAVSWLHRVSGLQPPNASPLVHTTLEGLQRKLAKPKKSKEPITVEMLKAMVEAVGPSPSLTDVRFLAVCLVAFAGFLRCDELIKLRCNDIVFNEQGMVVKIVSSKTDQFREGASLVIARTGTSTCPVGMMERYYTMAGLVPASPEKLFRAIVHTKTGERLRESGGLSYSRLRELLSDRIQGLGMDPKQFGMHSLRAGGATAAANAGVPDRLFKRHGRWRSESAKDGYVKDSVERRLSVSKSLGI